MDLINYPEFLESTGREIQSRIERAAYYKNPTGIGDAREDVVREYLQEVLPPRFCVDKGKIFDSEGRLSREFDIIISERIDVAPAMSLAGRRIVPIEAVYGVIEIKSKLDNKQYDNFIESVIELDQMRRFYEPYTKNISDDKKKKLENGFAPQDKYVGTIWSGFIAFEAPESKTICEYLSKKCEGFWFICVPGKELVSPSYKPLGFMGVPYGLKSLPLTIWLIMELITKNPRPKYLQPNFTRYREKIVNQIGDITNCWRCVEVVENERT